MDLTSLPACAMYRSVGTVIVRIKMEGSCSGHGLPSARTPVPLPSGCERCNRTRLISKHNSDCDSVVDKCRTYRSRTARSRYVNVCAAVCLLLLVGGLSPQSSAAPHPRKMDRKPRQADDDSVWWENPCSYVNTNSNGGGDPKKIAALLVNQAKNTLEKTSKYKNTLACTLHNYDSFEKLLPIWESSEYLREVRWFQDDVFPKEKKLNIELSDEHMDGMKNKIDQIVPLMFKTLKYVVAGLYAFAKDGLNDNITSYESLRESITASMHDNRAVLCLFYDYMKASKLEMMPLKEDELPDFTNAEMKVDNGLLLYRDTLNYLEYIIQVFNKIAESK